MWIKGTNNKWYQNKESLDKSNFLSYREDFKKVRFYSKCLSGSTYISIDNLDNIYDKLSFYSPKNWYYSSTTLLPYSSTGVTPFLYPKSIGSSQETFDEYHTKYLNEYGLTLKNLFTPKKLISNDLNNLSYVDVATIDQIYNLGQIDINLEIDGVKLKEGHKVLVKDQKTIVTLDQSLDPNTFFTGNFYFIDSVGTDYRYYYYNEDNGIYTYTNKVLVKTNDIIDYEYCIKYAVCVKMGNTNREKQFNLNRLLNGYYPLFNNIEPIEFKEKNNWVLRNRVDYNNLHEVVYNDIIKEESIEIIKDGKVYTIPERVVSVGEFGLIWVNQELDSNFIWNKYKSNLRSIENTSMYYWICGDSGTLLRVDKINMNIDKIEIGILTRLNSVKFYNNLRGVVVGDFNVIFYTNDGGYKWNKIDISNYDKHSYNTICFTTIDSFFIGGDSGILLEFKYGNGSWSSYKRYISKNVNPDDEYLLVTDIYDIKYYDSLSLNSKFLLIGSGESDLIMYSIGDYYSSSNYRSNYLDISNKIGTINNISFDVNTNNIYIGSDNFYSTNLLNYNFTATYSNLLINTYSFIKYDQSNINSIYFDDVNYYLCGNNSLLKKYDLSDFTEIDENFTKKLKSKLLYLDYDMGSKLNFFDDTQNYRLPNSISFSQSHLTSTISNTYSQFGFESLTYSLGTYSYTEMSWIDYWKDRSKTFEYYTHLDDSNKVEISFSFSSSDFFGEKYTYTSSQISTDYNSISNLAPATMSRYRLSTDPIIAPTQSDINLYLWDYLGIWCINNYSPISNDAYIEKGDIIKLSNINFEGQFLVNKVISTTTSYYAYFYTDFNEEMLNMIKDSDISIENLNKYVYTSTQSVDSLINKLNEHPINYIYDFEKTLTDINIIPKYHYMNAYYNIASHFNINEIGTTYSNRLFNNDIKYESSFFKFGYTPTYNILNYLFNIDNLKYTENKEFLSMPYYSGLLGPDYYIIGPTNSNIYFDTNKDNNKIMFGYNLKNEWTSFLKWIFVDIELIDDSSNSYSTERLLIIDKYYDALSDSYIIEFHKKLNYPSGSNIKYINIRSRRKLLEVSNDLQYLNNLHRPKNGVIKEVESGYFYSNDESDINYKVPTDSYSKILLSDYNIIKDVTGIFYVDYKNDISLNLTKVDKAYEIPISSTQPILIGLTQNVLINCNIDHELNDGDGVVLEFNGGTFSSEYMNQKYSGYHIIKVYSPNQFYLPGLTFSTGYSPDTGFVKYVNRDPFLNYQPIDIFDVGVSDKLIKNAVEITPINYNILNKTGLINIDFNKFKFRLIDGLDLVQLNDKYSWILEAEISNAVIGEKDNKLVWYKGNWNCGRWFGGIWNSGLWISGDWYDGEWNSKKLKDNYISIEVDNQNLFESESIWYSGRWFDGTWNNGTWYSGRWYNGKWNKGTWLDGTWNDGTWNDGNFIGGIWINGQWNNGSFSCDNKSSYWLDGQWNGGDFKNGMWYNGTFDSTKSKSRFGIESSNSRLSIWQSGKWINGDFYSKLNTDINGNILVSDIHKYSIWKTGTWFNGNFWGGNAFNINFKSGIWNGGVLDDIEIIGINNLYENSFQLNGFYKFNINDEFWVIDNNIDMGYSEGGSNLNPKKYRCINTFLNDDNTTSIVVDHLDILNPILFNNNYLIIPDNYNLSISGSYSYSWDVNTMCFTNNSIGGTISYMDLSDDLYNEDPIEVEIDTNSWAYNDYNSSYRIKELIKYTSIKYDSSYPYGYYIVFEKIINDMSYYFSFNDSFIDFLPIQANTGLNPINTGLKIVSKFNNAIWKSGVWYNGIFEDGNFNGGLWYNGIFSGNWGA